jgi:hypothetical protein
VGLNDAANGINFSPQPVIWTPYLSGTVDPVQILNINANQVVRIDNASVTISLSVGEVECSTSLHYSESVYPDPLWAPFLTVAVTSLILDVGEPVTKLTDQLSNPIYLPGGGGLAISAQGGGEAAWCIFWSLGYQWMYAPPP